MFHVCAFTASIALSSTKQKVAALNDAIMRIGGSNGFVPQEDMSLACAAAFGVGQANPYLTSPKLAQFNPLDIVPVPAVASPTDGGLVSPYRYRPFRFRAQEELTAYCDNTNAAAQQQTIVIWLSNGAVQVPNGDRLIIQASSTTAATAFVWSQIPYSLNQALPEGTYVMLGSRVFSTTGIAHRWTFWDQFYRPGMLSLSSVADRQFDALEDYYLGAMGAFKNTTLPNLEVLCGAADASHTIYMEVIKVA